MKNTGLKLSFIHMFAFTSLALITLFVAYYSNTKLNDVIKYADKLENKITPKIYNWVSLDKEITSLHILLNQHLVENDLKKKKNIEKEIQVVSNEAKNIIEKIIGTNQIQNMIEEVHHEHENHTDHEAIDFTKLDENKIFTLFVGHWVELKELQQKILDYSNDYMHEDAAKILQTGEGAKYFKILSEISKEMNSRARDLRSSYFKQTNELHKEIQDNLMIGALLAVVLSLLIGILVTRLINKNLKLLNNGLIDFFSYIDRQKKDYNLIQVSGVKELIEMSHGLNLIMEKIKVQDAEDSAKILEIEKGNYSVFIEARGEFDYVSFSINSMIDTLRKNYQKNKEENWIKDGLNMLGEELSTVNGLTNISNGFLNLVCKHTNCGIGALYNFNENSEIMELEGTFAFVEREYLSESFEFGHGIVGQVAKQKKPILLTHLDNKEAIIQSATTAIHPANTYTFPLLYDNNLIGVVEVGAVESFDDLTIEFFNSAADYAARYIYAATQEDEIKNALAKTQQANEALNVQSEELRQANEHMQEQQKQLEESSVKMEEQQQQLKMQAVELKDKNEFLEKSQNELHKRAEDLERADKYKSEFLANMSHELRTPLNSIILLSSLLSKNKDERLDVDDVKKVTLINQSGNELLRLINDILDLSKVESGKMEVISEEIDSDSFLSEFAETFTPTANELGLDFILKDDFNAPFVSDRAKVSQIVRNFLSNSFKFTKQGYIELSISKGDETYPIVISVTDTGIGIPKDKQQLIFEAFKQVDGGVSREYGGTGLGLSISKRFTHLLGGVIELDSEIDKGSSFIIKLPNLDESKKINKTTKNTSKSSPEVRVKNVIDISGFPKDDRDDINKDDHSILVIEDDPIFTDVLKDSIHSKNHKAILTPYGKEALHLLEKYDVTGIILDLGLPDIDGVELLKQLKSNYKTRAIPVHIISGREEDSSLENDVIGYLQKPVNPMQIKDVIAKIDSSSSKELKELVVFEKNSPNKQNLQNLFKDEKGFKLSFIESDKKIIKMLENNEVDTLIIDLNDDLECDLCEYIKKNNVSIPLIIYSQKALSEDNYNLISKYTDTIIIESSSSNQRLKEEVESFMSDLHKNISSKKEKTSTQTTIKNKDDDFLKGKKILVVDDDIKNVFVLSSALENFGADIISAKNGQDALDKLDENTDISLVLMDIMMPVMDGYVASEKIKANPQTNHIPIIAVTAKAMASDKQKCLDSGCDDYVTKPIDLDILENTVRNWVVKKV